jgi:hypothetical protein
LRRPYFLGFSQLPAQAVRRGGVASPSFDGEFEESEYEGQSITFQAVNEMAGSI